MDDHRYDSTRYYPARWAPLREPVRLLVVATSWQGSADTITQFIRRIRDQPNVFLREFDWRQEPSLADPSTGRVFADALDRAADAHAADIVLLLGGNLYLDRPLRTSPRRSVVGYHFSSISFCSVEQKEGFLRAERVYVAHSADLFGHAEWLPTGIDPTLTEPILRELAHVSIGSRLLLPWNFFGRPKDLERDEWLRRLQSHGVPLAHAGFRHGEREQRDPLALFRDIRECRLVLDHNRTYGADDAQLNSRFLSASAMARPTASIRCRDLDRCFMPGTEYLPLDLSRPIETVAEALCAAPDELLASIGNAAHDRTLKDHDWLSRWAKILFDYLTTRN